MSIYTNSHYCRLTVDSDAGCSKSKQTVCLPCSLAIPSHSKRVTQNLLFPLCRRLFKLCSRTLDYPSDYFLCLRIVWHDKVASPALSQFSRTLPLPCPSIDSVIVLCSVKLERLQQTPPIKLIFVIRLNQSPVAVAAFTLPMR